MSSMIETLRDQVRIYKVGPTTSTAGRDVKEGEIEALREKVRATREREGERERDERQRALLDGERNGSEEDRNRR